MNIVENVLRVINDKQDAIDALFESLARNESFEDIINILHANSTFMDDNTARPDSLLLATGEFYGHTPTENRIVITLDREKSIDWYRGTHIHISVGGHTPAPNKYDYLIWVRGDFNKSERAAIVTTLIESIKGVNYVHQ